MEIKTSYVLVGLGIFFFLTSLMVFLATKSSAADQGEQILEECKALDYRGEGRINILFFAQEEQAQKYTDFFLNAEPFNQEKDSFNFFYIDDYLPECRLYKNIAILCHDRELIKKAASCPHDFIVVLKEEDAKIRSSAYLDVMSINSRHVLPVFLHEFGHAFANFAEEYINNQNPPRGSENCQASCESFRENANECFDGCSQQALKRSINQGVMKTLKTSEFGSFNNNILLGLIQKNTLKKEPTITGNQISTYESCKDQSYILTEINAKTGETTSLELPGCPPKNLQEGDYAYSVFDKENNIIEQGKINPIIHAEEIDENLDLSGPPILDEEINLAVRIQKNREADRLTLTDFDKKTIAEAGLAHAGATTCQT